MGVANRCCGCEYLVGDDGGKDAGIERLGPWGIWRVGEGLGIELPLELEGKVYGCWAVRV